MEKKRLEFVVGAFVLLGTVIFAFFIFFMGGFYFLRSGYNIDVAFNYISGISKGATVRYAGVIVGEVVSLDTIYDNETQVPRIVLGLWIKEGIIVREKSKIEIRGAFALSEAHIEITTYGLEEGRILKDGDFTNGVDPVPLDDLIREGEEIARKLKETLTKVNDFVSDEEINYAIRNILVNINKLTVNMNALIDSSEGNIKGILGNTEKSSEDLLVTMQALRGMLEKASNKEGTVGKLINDEELYNELLAFVTDLKKNPWKLLKKTKEKDTKKKSWFS